MQRATFGGCLVSDLISKQSPAAAEMESSFDCDAFKEGRARDERDQPPFPGQAWPGMPWTTEDALELLSRIVAVIELTPSVSVHSFDRSGTVRYWNMASAELYGTPMGDALGQPWSALLSYGDKEGEFADAVAHVWRTGQSCPARDWHVRTAAGKALWINCAMFAVARGGEPEQIFCMDVDVTERKQEEIEPAVGLNFRHLFEQSADAILLIEDERIADANPAAVRLFQCENKERMMGRAMADFSPLQQPTGELSAAANAHMAAHARAEGNCRYDWRCLTSQGELFWAEVVLTSITLDRQYLSYALMRDISVRKKSERSLHLAAQVFENSRDAILVTDRQQAIISINRSYSEVTGFSPADMLGQQLTVYRAGVEEQTFYHQIWSEMAVTDHWQGEVTCQRSNGELYPAWMALTAMRDGQGAISNYMAILSDITERKKREEHTRHLAEHDFLTDLPNRVLLLDRLSLALLSARRKHSMLAILFLDLDHFKDINDSMGHQVGDLLLKEVAARLIQCVRGVDTVSRQGGDEFLIILADIGGIDHAANVAASLQRAVSQVYRLAGVELNVSSSIGVSVFPNDGQDMDTLIKNADIAMYHAKERGRNGFQFFNSEMNERTVERVKFENGLRQAVCDEEFFLEYQPQIDIGSGAMVGAEALIRWQHPELGRLLPERFIGVAEECGLMIPIGHWVLRQACRQARIWLESGYPVVVAVNLSVAQFMQKNLDGRVADVLRSFALPASLLELEVTEAIIMKGGASVIRTLTALRELGVKLTIDDFGTGYSRLSFLKNYPIDKLKIDRSFMTDITGNADDAAIITAIVAMAKSLKMKVSAEGVETAAQLGFLRGLGCDQYQGFYASSAMRAAELGCDGASWLARP